MHRFTLVLTWDAHEELFHVRAPAFPDECITFGTDEVHAISQGQDAIQALVDDRTACGEPIPEDVSYTGSDADVLVRVVDVATRVEVAKPSA